LAVVLLRGYKTKLRHQSKEVCIVCYLEIILTYSGLCHNPGQAQEQHNAPNVKETWDEHPLDPAQFDAMIFICLFRILVFDIAILWK
jgi:hypothetical protein